MQALTLLRSRTVHILSSTLGPVLLAGTSYRKWVRAVQGLRQASSSVAVSKTDGGLVALSGELVLASEFTCDVFDVRARYLPRTRPLSSLPDNPGH
jgi:hypothetical protein